MWRSLGSAPTFALVVVAACGSNNAAQQALNECKEYDPQIVAWDDDTVSIDVDTGESTAVIRCAFDSFGTSKELQDEINRDLNTSGLNAPAGSLRGQESENGLDYEWSQSSLGTGFYLHIGKGYTDLGTSDS